MTKQLTELLSPAELEAIKEFELELRKSFSVAQVRLFGSAARGESAEGSDMDVLVVLAEKVTHRIRNIISDIAFEVNYKHGTNISIVVFDEEAWSSGVLKLTPFYADVIREGVAIYEE